MQKPVDAYPKQVLEVVYLISYNRQEPAQNNHLTFYGSASNPDQKHPSDLDLLERVDMHGSKEAAAEELARGLQDIVMRVTDKDLIYMGETKAGIDHIMDVNIGEISGGKIVGFNRDMILSKIAELLKLGYISGYASKTFTKLCEGRTTIKKYLALEEMTHDMKVIRWEPTEVLAGRKRLIGGRYVDLQTALLDDTIIKIDVVAVIDGDLLEVSNAWEISEGKKHKDGFDVTNTSYIKGLKMQVIKQALSAKPNLMKACKRIATLAKVGGDTVLYNKMLTLFNGSCGELYQLIAHLKCIIFLLTSSYRSIPWKVITNTLDSMKTGISTLYDIVLPKEDIYKAINRITSFRNTSNNRRRMLKAVENIKDVMGKGLNREVEKYMESIKLWPLPSKYYE